MPINFDDIFSQLKSGAATLAKDTLKDFAGAAKTDALAFLNSSKEDLKRWANLLANGDITIKEFEFLLLAKKDSLKMEALKEAGLGAIKIDTFKSNLLNLVLDVILPVKK